MFKRVDFPEPDAPIIETNSPCSIIKSIPVKVSNVRIFLPSLPIIRPFISSFGKATTETVLSATWSAAQRWIAREIISFALFSASSRSHAGISGSGKIPAALHRSPRPAIILSFYNGQDRAFSRIPYLFYRKHRQAPIRAQYPDLSERLFQFNDEPLAVISGRAPFMIYIFPLYFWSTPVLIHDTGRRRTDGVFLCVYPGVLRQGPVHRVDERHRAQGTGT